MAPDSPERLDPELEQWLEEAVTGERQHGPVELVEYDPAWPERFELIREQLSVVLSARAITIEHIGSTAVPGLVSKPIIDILVTVADVEAEHLYAPPIVGLGYELRVREPGHRMFRPASRVAHVHVWPDGSDEHRDYLLLRDRLRHSVEDRAHYARLKRELATQDWPDVNYYAQAKGPLISKILEHARLAAGGL